MASGLSRLVGIMSHRAEPLLRPTWLTGLFSCCLAFLSSAWAESIPTFYNRESIEHHFAAVVAREKKETSGALGRFFRFSFCDTIRHRGAS
jgi:hypothetical protein